ncbi:hypothetical protein [Paenibacillus rigui]|uniref:Uncharacterized protein n=1 Tax=Paenibacillus rigui TaxID=554312 RepID=A0A229ULJ8_9BACL|nr:hypothetical protein [Paenibacillus rigui]OXM84347.1 hypothetical protein CF651_21445 [Paenibacillus rigui]
MPRKVLRSQSELYPFVVELNKTRVITREGKGLITKKTNEWIYVLLDKNNQTIKTSIYLVECMETA